MENVRWRTVTLRVTTLHYEPDLVWALSFLGCSLYKHRKSSDQHFGPSNQFKDFALLSFASCLKSISTDKVYFAEYDSADFKDPYRGCNRIPILMKVQLQISFCSDHGSFTLISQRIQVMGKYCLTQRTALVSLDSGLQSRQSLVSSKWTTAYRLFPSASPVASELRSLI